MVAQKSLQNLGMTMNKMLFKIHKIQVWIKNKQICKTTSQKYNTIRMKIRFKRTFSM